jgi:hypothetical protein
MLFQDNVHLQDILLQVVLGHSLRGSQSDLRHLSSDLIQNCIAPAIEECYWQSRTQGGLLTPKLKPKHQNRFQPPQVLAAETDYKKFRIAVARRKPAILPVTSEPFVLRKDLVSIRNLFAESSETSPKRSRDTSPLSKRAYELARLPALRHSED